ncbi:hypothetical protein [Streptococcus henryi]|uniref:hypothetical protein n=1 Tax=Streptococcus henryi TaxID=439219 RepID=UPI0003789A51|nr:hypothetical protein [Streptococcus henryi]
MNEQTLLVLLISTIASVLFSLFAYLLSSYLSKKDRDAMYKRVMEDYKKRSGK